MPKPRIVIDSNILVSILKGSRGLSPLYAAFKEGRLTLAVSSETLKELAVVLSRPQLQIKRSDIKELFRLIKIKALRVEPRVKFPDACRDPKDNFILELAQEAKADFVITNDQDLLVLKTFHNIPIISANKFIARLK
jgi:putative PIN family toxin of toxin-antitoxin system